LQGQQWRDISSTRKGEPLSHLVAYFLVVVVAATVAVSRFVLDGALVLL